MESGFQCRAAPSGDEQFLIECFRIRLMDEAEFGLMLAEMQLHLYFRRLERFWKAVFSVDLRLQVADDS